MYWNGCVSECLYQESAWGAAEASQEIIVDVFRKAIVYGKFWSMC